MKNHLLTGLGAFGLLALWTGCAQPCDEATKKAAADHMAMMKADSAENAMEAANMECMKKVFAMFDSGNIEGIEDCVAGNIIEHSPTPGITTTGLQGLKDVIAMHHTAMPDSKITVLNIVAEGDMVYAHFNMKGTNSGPMGDMPATNKAMDVNGVDIVRFENGKGVEHWGYWEESKMMQQMGMMPSPGDMGKGKDMKKKM